jgi:hypothetical protein
LYPNQDLIKYKKRGHLPIKNKLLSRKKLPDCQFLIIFFKFWGGEKLCYANAQYVEPTGASLLDSDRLGQVSREVNVEALENGQPVGNQL